MSWCTGPLVLSPVRDHTPRAMSRTGRTAQRPRMRGAARRLPGPVPLLPAGMRKGRAANTVRPARQQGPPRRRPEPDGVPGRRCPGTQPAPGGRPGGRRTRRLGRPGVLRPVTYCPPGRPPCRPPPGNFADSRAGHPAGPGTAPAQGPCPGRKDLEPCGSRRGGVVPRPAGTTPAAVRGGRPAGSGAMLPQSGPNRQQPALPTGAGGAPAACSAKATVTTGRPAPARCSLIGDLPPRLLTMTGRSGHQPSLPPGMSCPSRPRSRPGRHHRPARATFRPGRI